jgi:transketolase
MGDDVQPISLEELQKLKQIAERARKNVIRMLFYDQTIHVGSSLSSVEILTLLLSRARRDSRDPLNRDWIILSKGHAAPALYAILAEMGVIPKDELWKIQDINGLLQGHPETFIPGVDMSTGSLGQGLSFGGGIAMGIKMKGGNGKVFVIMGDGEQDEGQVWEAATHIAARKLDNVIGFIELNGYQLDGSVDEIKPKSYLREVWSAIGWNVLKADGHDITSLNAAIGEAVKSGKPSVILCNTLRGKGFPPIENTKKQRSSPDDARKYLVNA